MLSSYEDRVHRCPRQPKPSVCGSGELAPKSTAIRKAVPTALWVNPPLRFFYLVFKLVIWLLNGLARRENITAAATRAQTFRA
jgi:Cyclin M transmembrane N-terminal domain